MTTDNAFGRFLQARRALVRPEALGLPIHERRRVPGLRREELSLLAGVSIDYYVRLERGRDRHPSPMVVDALARALMLDADAAAHLRALAHPAPPHRRVAADEAVRPAVAQIIASWTDQPAVVLGRRMDVLASNAVAEALNPGFAVGTNLMRFIFLDGRARDRYGDWPGIAAKAVATLRATAGLDLHDAALTDLVEELSLKNEDFRHLWARHDVQEKTTGRKTYNNPYVGEITLDFESFAVAASPGQLLVVYTAEPGTSDERALRLLTTLGRDAAASSGSLTSPTTAGT